MYPNLVAELKRRDIDAIAQATKRRRPYVSDRIYGDKEFTLEDAALIRKALFPLLKLEYLFAPETR